MHDCFFKWIEIADNNADNRWRIKFFKKIKVFTL